MPVTESQATAVYTDFNALTALKGQSRSGDGKITKEVAKQFEAIFLQMMLSSMRKTVQVNEEFGNEKSTYYDLFDKQVAMEMSGHGGIGLADMLMVQLGGQQPLAEKQKIDMRPPERVSKINLPTHYPVQVNAAPAYKPQIMSLMNSSLPKDVASNASGVKGIKPASELKFDSPMQFIRQLWHATSDFIAEKGLNPRAIIAQAALETGWGKHIIKKPDGQSSHNLFGIKSNNGWSGDKVLANTLEFKNGVMDQSKESFRSYESLMDSVRDYVGFITGNDRYKVAIANQDNPDNYISELQRAGYATDPEYAQKIINIMNGKEFKQFFNASGIKNDG